MGFLEFKEVRKSFGKKEVLSGVSFSLKEGEIFGLVGNSGGGKSTLLRILVGMEKVSSGEILFKDKNVFKQTSLLRKTIGFAAQKDMLFEELTLEENAEYFSKLYSIKKTVFKKRFSELVKLLGLEGFEMYQIKSFSGGMQKRANILVSLIHDPSFLILDEPTVGLDGLLRDILWKYIRRINKEGTTILITSHLLEEIEENCSRIGVLKDGKIASLATMKEYRKHFKNKSFPEIFRKILSDEII